MGKIGTAIFEALMWPVQKMPLGYHYFWGRVNAWLARNVLRYRRDVVLTNLSRSFPEKKYKELSSLTDAFYDHFAEIIAEAIWFGGCRNNPERLRRQGICTVQDTTQLLESYDERPGVVILNSHFGNWELVGGLYEYFHEHADGENVKIRSENTCVVYKKIKSQLWDKFMRDNRLALMESYGGYVESSELPYFAIDHRDQKMLYIFPTDQHPYKGAASCEIPEFMHQKTTAMIGGTALACKFGFAVFNMSIDRKQRGKYSIRFDRICEDASKSTPAAIMGEYYRILEQDINSNPSNYLWSHKRWK